MPECQLEDSSNIVANVVVPDLQNREKEILEMFCIIDALEAHVQRVKTVTNQLNDCVVAAETKVSKGPKKLFLKLGRVRRSFLIDQHLLTCH